MAMRDGTAERRAELYREALVLIEREYADALQLDAVARRLATSRRQLQRAFAEAGETSFRAALAEVRMRRARELLAEGGMPVRNVAESVGYHQPAQFAKSFRRHHGAAPSSFRKRARTVSVNGSGNGNAPAAATAAPTRIDGRSFERSLSRLDGAAAA